MVKKIDAESVAREDMPSYKDRSLMSRVKKYIDDSHDPKKLPEMMRRKTAAETDVGKGEGILQKLRSPYQSGADTEYNKRNDATRDKYNASLNVKPSVKVDTKPISKNTSDGSDVGNGTMDGSDYGNMPSKKEPPVAVVKKQSTTIVKPKESGTSKPKSKYRNGYSESDIQAMIDKADNGKTAAFNEATNAYLAKQNPDVATAEDMNMQSKPDTPSVPMAEDTVGGNAMKKGGMTKRPPKPAKKVPPRKFASGGSTSRTSASKRGDGCATKGHTKGKYC